MTRRKVMKSAIPFAALAFAATTSGIRGGPLGTPALAAGVAGDELREAVQELLPGSYLHSGPEIRARGELHYQRVEGLGHVHTPRCCTPRLEDLSPDGLPAFG